MKDIRPAGPDGVKLRFNWNAGIAVDRFRTTRSTTEVSSCTSHGPRRQLVDHQRRLTPTTRVQKQEESGGLTLDVTGAENFETIIAIEPSPIRQGTCGSGRRRTAPRHNRRRDNVDSVERTSRAPTQHLDPHIKASTFDPATAFVVLDDHRRSNWTPYLFETTITAERGKAW